VVRPRPVCGLRAMKQGLFLRRGAGRGRRHTAGLSVCPCSTVCATRRDCPGPRAVKGGATGGAGLGDRLGRVLGTGAETERRRQGVVARAGPRAPRWLVTVPGY
jgi:hypothetical protein